MNIGVYEYEGPSGRMLLPEDDDVPEMPAVEAMPRPAWGLDGSLLWGADEEVAENVRRKVSAMEGERFGGIDPISGKLNYLAVGVVRRGILIGGIVFHHWRRHKGRSIDIEMSGAFDDPSWCIPATLRKLFWYPFIFAGCVRMTTITGEENERARKIDKYLGFKQEGIIRRGLDGVESAVVYGMLRRECRWIPKEARKHV